MDKPTRKSVFSDVYKNPQKQEQVKTDVTLFMSKEIKTDGTGFVSNEVKPTYIIRL